MKEVVTRKSIDNTNGGCVWQDILHLLTDNLTIIEIGLCNGITSNNKSYESL